MNSPAERRNRMKTVKIWIEYSLFAISAFRASSKAEQRKHGSSFMIW